MRNGPRHSLLFILLFFGSHSIAQLQSPRFIPIYGTGKIGLGKINAIARDKHGMMWFSDQTNQCIIRYDGEHMTRFVHDAQDSNSLGGIYPECFYTDSSGIIWIGFFGSGLDRFDPRSKKFTHYRRHRNDDEGLSSDSVCAVLRDHLGNLWVGGKQGLDLLDESTGKIRHYRSNLGDSTSLSSNFVRALYEDHEGTLWIGTGFPFDPHPMDGGLNRFERKQDHFTRFVHDPLNPHSLVNNKVRSIFEDSRGIFWVGTGGDGLHTMDRKTGLFERHPFNPSRPEQLSRPAVMGGEDHITFINEDYYRNIWIGTLANGLNRYDPKSKKITHFGKSSGGADYFKDNSGWCVNISKDGVFWLSTQSNNLYRVDLFNHDVPGSADVSGVTSFFQDGSHILWISSDSGLFRKNLETKESRLFVHQPGKKNSLSFTSIGSLIKKNDSMYWIGTWGGGVNLFNTRTEIFTPEWIVSKKMDSTLDYKVSPFMHKDGDSNLWISVWQRGFSVKNLKSGETTHYEVNFSDSNSLSHNTVVEFLEENADEMWVATFGNGVNKMNRHTGKFKHFLPGTYITGMFKDGKGILWVGAENGLFKYDRERDQFSSIGRMNGNFQINSVRSIVDDKEGNLWIGSLSGIIKIDLNNQTAIVFGLTNGVRGDLLTFGSAYRSADGKLYFGNSNGYFSFFPEQLSASPGSPNIELTDLWLNGRPVKPGPDGPLPENLQDTKEIELHHDQNSFSFGFNTIYYGNIADKMVYYKLENYDNDWVAAGADDKADYFNLAPGNYSFRVKVVDTNNGIWQEKNISITILSPWWKRWWAYVLYALALLLILVLFDRLQRRRIINRERERTKDRELAQAKEIEKAYHELKITQTQLIQQEKMASLGELTAGIAHEIQNPLNFVNNFSDVNTELIDEANYALEIGNATEAKSLLEGIRSNEVKIKFHGQRADAIVKGMLLHARSNTGQKELTDINTLADEYLRLSYQGLRARNKSFNAKLVTDFDPGVSKINIVSQDVGRVLLNLFNNAFYAVTPPPAPPAGGGNNGQKNNSEPVVWVSTKRIDSPPVGGAGGISISVRDNGPGISPKIIDKIFQPFFTTKPTGQGTGLGLSLSYDIIKAHGGQIKVENCESGGAEFTIILPV